MGFEGKLQKNAAFKDVDVGNDDDDADDDDDVKSTQTATSW